MNRKQNVLILVGIISLLALGLIVGKAIGVSLRGNYNRAAGTPSSASGPVLASGDFFSQEFASSTEIVPVSGLAPGGLSDDLLKTGVWKALLDYEQKQNCTEVTSKSIDVSQINEAGAFWVEDWTVNACGKTQLFSVKFKPDQVGGTIYEISRP